ncbi:FAD-dependent oxidoreductase [Streptosporangium longisporum]|uniref:FAD-binding domain-containing protein n=1 Tax=Streptosporangium longisporum TaxID=46187 RepID=A0ABP6KLE4_9ACTN
MPAGALDVLVVGGGIGGLALAQALLPSGVNVQVYEREREAADWVQGYRIHLNQAGARALRRCLPRPLWEVFLATSGHPGPGFGFHTHLLRRLLFVEESVMTGGAPSGGQYAVSRTVLRRILLAGLEDVVHHGRTFQRYEVRPDGKVVAFFSDGTHAVGDVLVGADGTASRVRGQYLPRARRVDTGALAIGARTPLDDHTRAWMPGHLADGLNLVLPPAGSAMFTATFNAARKAGDPPAVHPGGTVPPADRTGPADPADPEGLEGPAGDTLSPIGPGVPPGAAGADPAGRDAGPATQEPGLGGLGLDPGSLTAGLRDYVLWAFVARRGAYPAGAADLDGHGLRDLAGAMTSGWHPVLRRLVAEADPATIRLMPFRTSVPVEAWPATRVTLLGDAIHAMTPAMGFGANVALRDAALLADRLVAFHRGEGTLTEAVGGYEERMREYGFRAVRTSARLASFMISDRSLVRRGAKAWFRLCDALPPVRRMTFGGQWTDTTPQRAPAADRGGTTARP